MPIRIRILLHWVNHYARFTVGFLIAIQIGFSLIDLSDKISIPFWLYWLPSMACWVIILIFRYVMRSLKAWASEMEAKNITYLEV